MMDAGLDWVVEEPGWTAVEAGWSVEPGWATMEWGPGALETGRGPAWDSRVGVGLRPADIVDERAAMVRERAPVVREPTAAYGAGMGVPDATAETSVGMAADAIAQTAADATAETSAEAAGEAAVDPDDELFVLGERCAEAYMQADALQYRAMTLLAEYHHREGWRDTGFGSTAEWLAWRVGIKPGTARERVRTALALEGLPKTSQAMANGELSFAKVRALTRVGTADNEEALLELARSGSAANLERVVRSWRHVGREGEVEAEQVRYRRRTFSAFIDDDGTVVVRGRLDPEAGALLMRAIEAAGDTLFRADPDEAPRRRRADALGLIAERALGAGFGAHDGSDGTDRSDRSDGADEGDASDGAGRSDGAGGADGSEASDASDGAAGPPISGSRAARTQVVLYVDESTLREDGEPGRSELEDGTRVSAETARRIACDTGVVPIVESRCCQDASDTSASAIARSWTREILSIGRRQRTVPNSIRRALEARDRGCRFPGCGLRFTEGHHVRHWADGGETSLDNLVLLCYRHHRVVHEGGVRVCIDKNQQIVFFTPKGAVLAAAPPHRRPVTVPSPAPNIEIRLPGYDGSARSYPDAEIPWAIEARAREALDCER